MYNHEEIEYRRATVKREIESLKKSLIRKARKNGFHENFGDKEYRALEDRYGKWKWDDTEIGTLFTDFWAWTGELSLEDIRV